MDTTSLEQAISQAAKDLLKAQAQYQQATQHQAGTNPAQGAGQQQIDQAADDFGKSIARAIDRAIQSQPPRQ